MCLRAEISTTLASQAIWNFFQLQAKHCAYCRIVIVGDNRNEATELSSKEHPELNLSCDVHYSTIGELTNEFNGLDTAPLLRVADAFKVAAATPVVERIKLSVASEVSAMTLRRQVMASEQDRARRTDQSRDGDAQTLVRNVIQKNFQDVERNFRQKYDELSMSSVGALANIVDAHVDSLSSHHILKVERAANFEKYESQIDQAFLSDGIEKIRQALNREMKIDEAYLNRQTSEAEATISNILRQNNYKYHSLAKMAKPVLDISKHDQSHFKITKSYKGELTKPGIMEYFGALRDYTGLIMVIVGILAPLTMLATAPDADKDSFLYVINSFSTELKNVRAYVQFFTIVLIFSMLSYGIFDLRKRIPNKRVQEIDREVLLAKDFVREQLTRMMNEANRDWVSALGQYVKDYSQSLQSETEALIKQQVNENSQISADKRRVAQLEQTSVEHRLKILSGAERSVDGFYRRFHDALDRMQSNMNSKAGARA